MFFDLKNTKLAAGLKKVVDVNGEYVKGVRFGQFDLNTVRVVFDLSSQSYNFKILNLEDPARLVVDIFGSGRKASDKDEVKAAVEPEFDAIEPESRSSGLSVRR